MKLIKPFIGIVAILLSYNSSIFCQAPISKKKLGLSIGISTFSQENTSSFERIPSPSSFTRQNFSRTEKIVPTIGGSYFFSKKEGRLKSITASISAGSGHNIVHSYKKAIETKASFGYQTFQEYLPKDNYLGEATYKPFTYFNVSVGSGLYRYKTFKNKLNFIYGFEGFLGYKRNAFSQIQFNTQEDQSVVLDGIDLGIGVRLILTYPINDNISFMATTKLASIKLIYENYQLENEIDNGFLDLDATGDLLQTRIGIIKNI